MLSLGCDGSVSFSEALSSGIHLYAFLHADTQARIPPKEISLFFPFSPWCCLGFWLQSTLTVSAG